jgi:hypothetical protein
LGHISSKSGGLRNEVLKAGALQPLLELCQKVKDVQAVDGESPVLRASMHAVRHIIRSHGMRPAWSDIKAALPVVLQLFADQCALKKQCDVRILDDVVGSMASLTLHDNVAARLKLSATLRFNLVKILSSRSASYEAKANVVIVFSRSVFRDNLLKEVSKQAQLRECVSACCCLHYLRLSNVLACCLYQSLVRDGVLEKVQPLLEHEDQTIQRAVYYFIHILMNAANSYVEKRLASFMVPKLMELLSGKHVPITHTIFMQCLCKLISLGTISHFTAWRDFAKVIQRHENSMDPVFQAETLNVSEL